MDKAEKLREAKLMAVEKRIQAAIDEAIKNGREEVHTYYYAELCLQDIQSVEIAEELRQHEHDLLIESENKPE